MSARSTPDDSSADDNRVRTVLLRFPPLRRRVRAASGHHARHRPRLPRPRAGRNARAHLQLQGLLELCTSVGRQCALGAIVSRMLRQAAPLVTILLRRSQHPSICASIFPKIALALRGVMSNSTSTASQQRSIRSPRTASSAPPSTIRDRRVCAHLEPSRPSRAFLERLRQRHPQPTRTKSPPQ